VIIPLTENMSEFKTLTIKLSAEESDRLSQAKD
jgi:hypothetical protein